MAKQLDPRIAETLKKYGATKDALWDCHGTWVVYHAALERVAATAGVVFQPPMILEADGDKRCVALCVTGEMGGRSEWSVGEASPHNYIVKGKMQAYPYAMAEKRGKDRVILKLIGLQGLVYSEEESEDFRQTGNTNNQPEPPAPPAPAAAPVDKVKNAPGVSEAKNWVRAHIHDLMGSGNPDEFMEHITEAKARWVRICAVYPNIWTGPEGTGLRGEAMKIAANYECRTAFDLFVQSVEAEASNYQQEAAQ